jgi:hypothetical protein
MCSLHVNPFIKDYTKIFYMIGKGAILYIQCKMSLSVPKSMRKVDGLSFISIDFYVPVLTPHVKSTEISLQLYENIFAFVAYTQTSSAKRHRHHVFGAYHLYTDCTMWGAGWNLAAPLLVYPVA